MAAQRDGAGTDRVSLRRKLLDTLDPSADAQRWYSCNGCGWPCINPIGTVPERNDLCLDCAVDQGVSVQLRLEDF